MKNIIEIIQSFSLVLSIGIILLFQNCENRENLVQVSIADFSAFILETNYVTDAEKYDWSIIQEDVHNFRTQEGAYWWMPNAIDSASRNMPVTQVSYNDAEAYCRWAKVRLPSYDEFWQFSKNDSRIVNHNTNAILPVGKTNFIGNTWDITNTENARGEIRLAGGSFLCNSSTCNGTQPDRVLFVDKETGNIHISFSVIKKQR